MEESKLAIALKLNELVLNEDKNLKISNFIEDKVTKDNVLIFYSLAKLYRLASISESFLNYIERCFPMVAETNSFLHLDFSLVAKILDSSELNVHSEVEIFNAASNWLKHNSKERIKYATELLLKVRLHLLSEHALKYMISENVNMFEEALKNENYFKNKSKKYHTSRLCCQNNFNFLICGKNVDGLKNSVSNVKQIIGSNLNCVKDLAPMNQYRKSFECVDLKGEVYVFGGYDNADNLVKLVAKYSPLTNTWNEVTNMFDDRRDFCCCAFMDIIFILGGCYENEESDEVDYFRTTNSCLQFGTKNKIWNESSGMIEERYFAACVVFQENIVVSGGMDINHESLKTVESFNVFADKWSEMPDMINGACFHSLVVVKNKLFVIKGGNNNCEVFDSVCEKFIDLESPDTHIYLDKALSAGNKIILFENSASVIIYDVVKDEWYKFEESSDAVEALCFSCAKMIQY